MSESLPEVIIFEDSWVTSEILENWERPTESWYLHRRSQRITSPISNTPKAVEQTIKQRIFRKPWKENKISNSLSWFVRNDHIKTI